MGGKRNHIDQLEKAIQETAENIQQAEMRAETLNVSDQERDQIISQNDRRMQSIEGYRKAIVKEEGE